MIIDKIDPTEWLAESFTKTYPLAARRTAEVGGNHKSQYRSPLDVLLDRGVIDVVQYRSGRFVMGLRLAINNNLRTDRIVMEYEESEEPVQNLLGPGAMLNAVMANLKPWQAQMIDRICLQRQRQDYGFSDRPLNDNDYRWISHCCESVQKSLDQLKKNIDTVLDSLKNERRADGITTSRVCL